MQFESRVLRLVAHEVEHDMETLRATLKNCPKSGREAYYVLLIGSKGLKTAIMVVSMAFSCCESKSASNMKIISEMCLGTSN